MEPTPRKLLLYTTSNGRSPFEEWLNGLKDINGRAHIRKRLNRVRLGNLGVNRNLGDGVWELKFDFGPGYRIYYAEDGENIILLLAGGDKSSQSRDIILAKRYWENYNE